jgi:hypothetical protein
MRRHVLLGSELGRQFRHRDVRFRLDPFEQRRKMRRQLPAARRAALARRLRRTGAIYPSQQLHREARAYIEQARRRSTRPSILHYRLHAFPKIQRIGNTHSGWPPSPARSLNQIITPLGIP